MNKTYSSTISICNKNCFVIVINVFKLMFNKIGSTLIVQFFPADFLNFFVIFSICFSYSQGLSPFVFSHRFSKVFLPLGNYNFCVLISSCLVLIIATWKSSSYITSPGSCSHSERYNSRPYFAAIFR